MDNPAIDEILTKALALPDGDRVWLAGELLGSVKAPGAWNEDDSEYEEELVRRQRSLRDGTAATFTAEETVAAMRKALADRGDN